NVEAARQPPRMVMIAPTIPMRETSVVGPQPAGMAGPLRGLRLAPQPAAPEGLFPKAGRTRQGGSDFSRGRGRRRSLPQRPDLPPPLPQRPAAVVLLQAAALAEVLGQRRDLVVAADRFAARHAQPRVRQGLEAFGGDVGPAPLARTGRDGHSDSLFDRGPGAGPGRLPGGYPWRPAPLSLGRRRPAFGSPPAGHRPALHSLPDLFPRKSA